MKRNIRNALFTLFFFFFIFVSSMNSAYSYWNIAHDIVSSAAIPSVANEPVCYTKSDNKRYTSIEKALELAKSGDTVFVIPGTKYEIKSSVEIKSGVTLSLPFQDEVCFSVYKITNGAFDINGTETASATEALHNPTQYLKTQITLKENVKMVNNGTINVGGVIGSIGGGYSPAGQTCYNYSEIICNGLEDSSAQIENYGVIKNTGSIKGKSQDVFGIENFNGSTLETNFVVYENRGGSALSGMGGGLFAAAGDNLKFEVSPFNRIYMPNTSVKMKTNYGSNIIGLANMFGNGAHNQCNIDLITTQTSSLFTLKENSYVYSQSSLKDITIGTKAKKYDLLKLDFYGNVSIQYLNMAISAGVSSAHVKTNTVLFPISYYNEVSFNKINEACTVTSSQNIKILPGGKLSIGEDVTFKVDKMAVYAAFNDTYTNADIRYPADLEEGKFLCNGHFDANIFGGVINTSNSGSSVIIKNNSIDSKEVTSADKSNATYQTITTTAEGDLSVNGDGTDIARAAFNANVQYVSKMQNSNIYYWTKSNAVIYSSTMTSNVQESGEKAEGTFEITVTITASDNSKILDADVENIKFTISPNEGTISAPIKEAKDNNIIVKCTVTTPANSSDTDIAYTLEFTADVKGQKITSNSLTLTAKGGCLTSDTLITLADGSKKYVSDINLGDMVKTWDFETGEFTNKPVIYIEKTNPIRYERINVEFNDGTYLGIVYQHTLFDMNLRNYFVINHESAKDAIGKVVMAYDNGKLSTKTITNVTFKEEYDSIYEIVTGYDMNFVSNDVVSAEGMIITNTFFDIDEKYKYNQVAKERDIALYGLYTYEEFSNYLTKEQFELLNGAYFKIGVAKGYYSEDYLYYMINRFKTTGGMS